MGDIIQDGVTIQTDIIRKGLSKCYFVDDPEEMLINKELKFIKPGSFLSKDVLLDFLCSSGEIHTFYAKAVRSFILDSGEFEIDSFDLARVARKVLRKYTGRKELVKQILAAEKDGKSLAAKKEWNKRVKDAKKLLKENAKL